MASIIHFLQSTLALLWLEAQILALSATIFGSLALLVKGDEAFAAARQAADEIRINLSLILVDALFVGPVLAVLVQAIRTSVSSLGVAAVSPERWTELGTAGTLFAAVFLQDFVSYWRHRLEHTRLLWPAHAVHHSDTQMMWLTLARFHPVNRLTTAAIDIACLALVGFPAWALLIAQMVAHYYGEFVHADVPWTLGPLRHLLVSPVMHRWHHARDVTGAGNNFATVFSVFDQAFGTYHVPGPCLVPLGVSDDIGPGALGQLRYPFVTWSARVKRARRTSGPWTAGP